MSYPTSAEPPFATGLYWRKSLLNARKCIPVILVLADGLLTMSDKSSRVFSIPASQISLRRSRWGTLLITCGSTTYALVGRGGDISPQFTDEQIAHLDKLGAPTPPKPMRPSRAGSGQAMLFNTEPLAARLRQAGATVS
ncbi:hypothetical protein [Flexivirga alba]|uniref:Uncharacterized protein n=1 Tax=Flexivirga alba TaxID=702742 RepID=A0ABW2AA20_9MICO